MISFIVWLNPWPPLPLPAPSITSVCCSQEWHGCLSCDQLQSAVCALFVGVVCVLLLACLVPSFKYTTARIRKVWLAPLALARFTSRTIDKTPTLPYNYINVHTDVCTYKNMWTRH